MADGWDIMKDPQTAPTGGPRGLPTIMQTALAPHRKRSMARPGLGDIIMADREALAQTMSQSLLFNCSCPMKQLGVVLLLEAGQVHKACALLCPWQQDEHAAYSEYDTSSTIAVAGQHEPSQ